MRRTKNTPTDEESSLDFHPVFRHLTEEEKELVNFEKNCSFSKRGEILFHEGKKMTGFYFINKGIVNA
jgi:CRP-like cAMP-binding protein